VLAREEDTARLDILDNILFVLFCLFVCARAFIYDETNIIGLCVTRESVSLRSFSVFFSLLFSLSLSFYLRKKSIFFRTSKNYEIYTKREERKSNKLSLKNRERVLSFHTNTHAHALKTGKKESAKRRRDAAGAAQTESKERLGSGHSARARARKK